MNYSAEKYECISDTIWMFLSQLNAEIKINNYKINWKLQFQTMLY